MSFYWAMSCFACTVEKKIDLAQMNVAGHGYTAETRVHTIKWYICSVYKMILSVAWDVYLSMSGELLV